MPIVATKDELSPSKEARELDGVGHLRMERHGILGAGPPQMRAVGAAIPKQARAPRVARATTSLEVAAAVGMVVGAPQSLLGDAWHGAFLAKAAVVIPRRVAWASDDKAAPEPPVDAWAGDGYW